jgi:phenylacetate-coenzyme A ligase PaaK-like adenylate-forming protein
MSDSLAEQIYPRLPVFLQNAACWYYGKKEARVRFGAEFERRLQELVDSEKWSASEIEAYQNEKLRALIRHAFENVPYYRERWKALKIAPDDVRSRDDLYKLPVLTKEEIRKNADRFISQKTPRRELLSRHTSGTTGKGLHFYMNKEAVAFQWAVWWRHRLRFGVTPGTWHANFTGQRVIPITQRTPPYWRWNRPMRQVLINMQSLTPGKIASIVELLNSQGLEFYSGYPSFIHMLALNAADAGLRLTSPPRVIFTGAENMFDFQRRDIEAFTGAVLTDHYGCTEACCNASRCPEFVYHEDFEFGIMEGLERAPGDRAKTIVCTGFACDAFPFIRYEVGDTAVWQDGNGCACGRSSRVLLRVEGRTDDYVVTPEGARIARLDYLFKDALNVKEAQIVQERLGEIEIRLVRRSAYGAKDELEIRRDIRSWLSPSLEVRFEYVQEIPREPNGKFRAVLSQLKSSPSQVSEKVNH